VWRGEGRRGEGRRGEERRGEEKERRGADSGGRLCMQIGWGRRGAEQRSSAVMCTASGLLVVVGGSVGVGGEVLEG
jgi:hypothetical protein